METLLVPHETDLALLRAYLSALASASVIRQRAPLMYLIAVHHLNHFLFNEDGERSERVSQFKMIIAKQLQVVQTSPNPRKTWRYHLLFYKSFNLSVPDGFEMYQELPEERGKTLKHILPT
ncbi:putative RNA polymerase II-associated protein 1 [Apostichopus japonicus]|uniref:Putative RNA polymerase II-associated protein 1 n=1 Tax=Stichopus japonicus TaxID=307972 RepID=A0A2G8LML5_STIJA|nr:putative RNA polymerase II-associated protein 1 [Apostichopus japonicus]